MARIAFLGVGAMGSRMVRKLKEGGHETVVWNRTESRLADLAEAGFELASSPRQAADGADVVFSMIRDDEASNQVWLDDEKGALQVLGEDAVAIDCATLSLPHVQRLAKRFERAGRAFLDAPVAGSRPQAEVGRLIFFVGGRAETLEKVRPVLNLMGGAVHHAGGHGAGATVKLMVNALFGTQLAVVAELIGLADKTGMDVGRALEIVRATPVCSAAVGVASKAMLEGQFAPAFPIDLVAKDFRLVQLTARALGASLPVSDATGTVYGDAVTANYGEDNITGVVRLYSSRSRQGET